MCFVVGENTNDGDKMGSTTNQYCRPERCARLWRGNRRAGSCVLRRSLSRILHSARHFSLEHFYMQKLNQQDLFILAGSGNFT